MKTCELAQRIPMASGATVQDGETMRLLVLGCSRAKRSDLTLLPALARYDGPLFRLVRRWQRVTRAPRISLRILSARHGLIDANTAVGYYDEKMTRRRAEELRPHVLTRLAAAFQQG